MINYHAVADRHKMRANRGSELLESDGMEEIEDEFDFLVGFFRSLTHARSYFANSVQQNQSSTRTRRLLHQAMPRGTFRSRS